MRIKCTISTPQHANGKVHHFHTQSGEFDTEDLMFYANRGMFNQWVGGDHDVKFHDYADFEESRAYARTQRQVNSFERRILLKF